MTMLDRMRRHKNWLKWSLGLVCLTFVLFYIPDFLQTQATGVPGDSLGTVESRPITMTEFRRRYLAQLNAYRTAYGENLTDAALRQMQIEQQVLQQMIAENAELVEAQRAGIQVSDEEVRTAILTMPALQENGRFIGEQRYRDLLQAQNPPLTPAAFEQGVRQGLVLEKFRSGLTEWISIPEADLENEYRRRNEKVTMELVSVLADSFKNSVVVNDDEVAAFYKSNPERYRVPEQRKIRYVRFDTADIAAKITVPREELQRYYDEHIAAYTTPEQIRASHILLRTEGKQEAEVRARGEEILKQLKAGADFAELAKKYSEDESNASQGGDLDYFTRGRMVAEFENAAFALQAGQTSELVRTDFGFHIIRVTDKRPAINRPLTDPDVTKEITELVARAMAEQQATADAEVVAREGTTPQALEKAAPARGLKVEESGFFTREGRIEALGPGSGLAFQLEDNKTSGVVTTETGRIVFYVSGKRDSSILKFEEVRATVRDDLIGSRAAEVARLKAEALAAAAKETADLQRMAKSAGLEAVKTEPLTRDAVIPNIGQSPEISAVAFSLPVGGVSGAIPTPQGAAVVKVVARQGISPADFAAAKDNFRTQVLNERRTRFYQSYMAKARTRMKIEIAPDALTRVMAEGS